MGPDYERQRAIAREVRGLFETTAGVVDVDDYLEADQVKYVFSVDRAKAALAGIPSEEIVRTLRLALEGADVGLVHIPKENRPGAGATAPADHRTDRPGASRGDFVANDRRPYGAAV
jgi:multidrug efflux pump subunit AcrB